MATRILIVDDSEIIRATVGHAFKSFDCEVVEASDGVQGLASAFRVNPSLILLDVSMPVMDGIEMLHRVRADRELQGIPVIMLTSEAARDTVVRVAKIGVRDYIVKPFTEAELVDRVSRVTDLKARHGCSHTRKNYDDRLDIVVVDDKPTIHDQIRNGLSDTNWQVDAQTSGPTALERIRRRIPDVILISTSLPDRGGFWLLESIQKDARMKRVPVFSLSVRTATEDHQLALRMGISDVITKPIEAKELKTKIVRALNLDISSRYFDLQREVLVLTFVESFDEAMAWEVSSNLEAKLAEAVDAGVDKLIVDFSQLRKLDLHFVQLCLAIQQFATQLSVRMGVVASVEARRACINDYEDTKDWVLGETLEGVLEALKICPPSPTRLPANSPYG